MLFIHYLLQQGSKSTLPTFGTDSMPGRGVGKLSRREKKKKKEGFRYTLTGDGGIGRLEME